MTQPQAVGLLFLLIFGFWYDLYVGAQPRPFVARYVIVGVVITILVAVLDSAAACYSAPAWGVIMYTHFAASGLGMTLGSWSRRE